MCNKTMLAGFPTFNLSKEIKSINGIPVTGNISVPNLTSLTHEWFFIGLDENDVEVLSISKSIGASFSITDEDDVIHVAESYVAIFNVCGELVGGRPPVKR